MSNCEISRQLGAYLDGELGADECQRIEQHLASCPMCAAEVGHLQRISRLVGSWEAPLISLTAMRSLHAAVDGAGWRRLERLAFSLASIAACLAITTAIWPRSEAAPAMATSWERAAVRPAEETSAGNPQEIAMAQWVVADLSAGGTERE